MSQKDSLTYQYTKQLLLIICVVEFCKSSSEEYKSKSDGKTKSCTPYLSYEVKTLENLS